MDIWHVENMHWAKLILWRTDEDTFRVAQDGEYNPLLTNGNYILVNKKYADIFRQLHGQVAVREVKIVDFEFNTQNNDYVELLIANEIDPDSIKVKDSEWAKIWRCEGYVFVTGSLKEALASISNSELHFNLGFSHFCG
ncbi:hypothetical protein HB364_18220 [Pseudoflavitalea sp. X16]|uniref:hypothetical protein n=1 Tax=Paraflavitalea devenefica TaxID=2716334 RepID=UPI001423C07F|nr:hypothetical protein [Paraflavitalea devenefica]NII27032.1 hypothetical protein [Paraflavitalea devenefica]